MDNAAKDFAENYNDDSIRCGFEYGSLMHITSDGMYYYEYPYTNNMPDAVRHIISDTDTTIVAMLHTHGSFRNGYMTEFFSFGSDSDTSNAQILNLISYLATPGGKLLKYIPTGDFNPDSFGLVDEIVDSSIPSDPNSGRRRKTSIDAFTEGSNDIYIFIPRN